MTDKKKAIAKKLLQLADASGSETFQMVRDLRELTGQNLSRDAFFIMADKLQNQIAEAKIAKVVKPFLEAGERELHNIPDWVVNRKTLNMWMMQEAGISDHNIKILA